jgi:hypothetical protein
MSVQSSGWNDRKLMMEWVNRVYKPWMKLHSLPRSLLLMDDFKGHWVPEVVKELTDVNAELLKIPPGYTGKLQVLDVGINKPFHHHTLDLIELYMMENFNEETRTFRKPKRPDIANRIELAWEKISSSTIANTWRHIGIHHAIQPVRATIVTEPQHPNVVTMAAICDLSEE